MKFYNWMLGKIFKPYKKDLDEKYAIILREMNQKIAPVLQSQAKMMSVLNDGYSIIIDKKSQFKVTLIQRHILDSYLNKIDPLNIPKRTKGVNLLELLTNCEVTDIDHVNSLMRATKIEASSDVPTEVVAMFEEALRP